MRFARLLRIYWSRLRITLPAPRPQRPDLRKRATPGVTAGQGDGPDLVDLLANPRIVGTEKR
ncbi:hypothetical protein [Streptomyces sp. NPDC020951]|uniref:hypothetical protein n=1 Tax=Streptomyces sp. NPDC020951 TaxID=3365104 RepID=UPI0037B58F0E